VLLFRIKPVRVHLRGLNLFPIIFIYKIFKRVHLTLDPRGAFPEEILMRFNSKFLFYVLNFIEFLYFISGDSVIFVSDAFKKHIFSKYPCLKIKNVVIPTFYVEKNLSKSSFNFSSINSESDKFKLVYVGSMDVWQNFDKVVDFCNELGKLRYPFILHIITKDESTALKYLNELNFKNFTIDSLKPYEIADFLNRMDIAFVFRENSTVNKVSSPVKIQEYLYSGLFVLLSNGIGDLSDFIRSNHLGYILDDFTEKDVANAIKVFVERKSNRQDNIRIFLNYYDNGLKLNTYQKLF
jgi:glycosyltransferase involved in cell wall biosynthesis